MIDLALLNSWLSLAHSAPKMGKKIVDFLFLFFREINLVRKKHTSLALFHSTAPLESIFSSKLLLVNRLCTYVKKICLIFAIL